MPEDGSEVGRWWSPAHTEWFAGQTYFLSILSILLAAQASAIGSFAGFRDVVPDVLVNWFIASVVTVFLLGFMEEPWPLPRRSLPLPAACLTLFLLVAGLALWVAHKAGVPTSDGFPSAVGVGLGSTVALFPWRWGIRWYRSRRTSRTAQG